MSGKFHSGELKHKAKILRVFAADTEVAWKPLRSIWCRAERKNGTNIFSSVGLSAESWEFVLRQQDITVEDAIEWKGQHFFLTDVRELKPGFLVVSAAKVHFVSCVDDGSGLNFPAVLTEKYLRHEEPRPHSMNVLCFVLVTPKAVNLDTGSLVKVDGELYEVLVRHTLDGHKNEYEIYREADL